MGHVPSAHWTARFCCLVQLLDHSRHKSMMIPVEVDGTGEFAVKFAHEVRGKGSNKSWNVRLLGGVCRCRQKVVDVETRSLADFTDL